jgi:GT2 family glycosyltransferase
VSARVTVVIPVLDQLALTRACLQSLAHTAEPLELIVMDNGSTDGTRAYFEGGQAPRPVRYERNPAGTSVMAALNRGWRLAATEAVCFLHNDTEMVEPAWLGRLLAALAGPGVGMSGLYGIKRLRRNGRYVGRTIVHSLAEGPTVRPPWEEVAVVDSVCMCLSRAVLEEVGGFDEGYGPQHGLDRDLSFAVRETGRRCVVVHAPFRHRGGGTRTRDFAADPERERRDRALRQAVLDRFVEKFGHRLPCDVRPLPTRVAEWVTGRGRHALAGEGR